MGEMVRGLAELTGAFYGALDGLEVVERFGDPLEEYAAVRRTAGAVPRQDLGIVRLWGRDPVKMLNGLITNDLGRAPPGRAIYAAMLTPKGRMITDLRAYVLSGEAGTEVIVDYPLVAREPLRQHLSKYLPPHFAKWEFAETVGTIGVYGPASADIVRRLLDTSPADDEDALVHGAFSSGRVTAIATRVAGGEPGYDLHVPETLLPTFWEQATATAAEIGGRTVGMEALEMLRVEAGRPRFGRELTEETMPAEAFESTGQMARAISFTKGCYTGQEVVVRLAHRGHVNRLLRGLLLGDEPPVPAQERLTRPGDAKEVGWVTSSLHSPMLGQTVALAYVRREVEIGTEVRVGDRVARVVELPFRAAG